MQRQLLMVGLGFVSFWDAITTVYGTSVILGKGEIQIAVSILFAIVLSAFMIRTIPIIKNPSEELVPIGAKVLWFLAVLYDLFTSFRGNYDLVLGNVAGIERIVIAIGLTIFVCSAPIGLSHLLFHNDD